MNTNKYKLLFLFFTLIVLTHTVNAFELPRIKPSYLWFGEWLIKSDKLRYIEVRPRYKLEDSVEMITKHEGFRNNAYPDLGGGWSIGYGTVSYKGEFISERVAMLRLEYLIKVVQDKIIIPRLGYIPSKDMIALTDIVYNVRVSNYENIFKKYEDNDDEGLKYALRDVTYACKDGKCTQYGGLINRFNHRLVLLDI